MPELDQCHAKLPDPMTLPTWHEQPVVFECDSDRLVGIIAHPERPIETGAVIIVGGPQYRAGSHRQFTLLARQLAAQGIASIRFDYRGMGDSEGDMRNFEDIEADIRAAIDTVMKQVPNIKKIALWGLCDAASAAIYYGHTDPRVKSMVLLNPWVHTEAGAARARLRHYYLARLLSKAFWAKLVSGKVRLGETIGDLSKSTHQISAGSVVSLTPSGNPRHGGPGYIDRMLDGFKKFKGKTRVILSGNDLTAQEFESLLSTDVSWRKYCANPQIAITRFREANHTFSSRNWRNQVGEWSSDWIYRS